METGRKIGLLLKLARKTLLRGGVGALLLLTLGFSCLFPAFSQLRALGQEARMPRELLISSADANLADRLRQISGLESLSPQICLQASLVWEDSAVDLEISALWAAYQDLSFTQGAMYPDGTAMPWLVLNEAAVKVLSQDLTSGDTLTLIVGENQIPATLCGIFADESQTPMAYMSYDTAQTLFGSQDTSLCLRFQNRAAAADARKTLAGLGLTPAGEDDVSTPSTWWMFLGLSPCFLGCGAILLRERRRGERRDLEVLLALSGLEESYCSLLYSLRLGLTLVLCACTAALVAVFII